MITEQICLLSLKPEASVIDKRGRAAEALAQNVGLKTWGISTDTIQVGDSGDDMKMRKRVTLSFNSLGLIVRGATDADSFLQLARQLVEFTSREQFFDANPNVFRIGVRGRFLVPYSSDFASLLSKFQARYYRPAAQLTSVLGNKVEVTDVCSIFNFKDEQGFFNTQCGPMLRDQAHKQYFAHEEENEIPKVALYFDIDQFKKPGHEMKWSAIIHTVEAFTAQCWRRLQVTRDLILDEDSLGQQTTTTGSVPAVTSQAGSVQATTKS